MSLDKFKMPSLRDKLAEEEVEEVKEETKKSKTKVGKLKAKKK